LGHELGHNFGLFHSRSIDCGHEVISGICTTNEYGDKFDLMGPGVPYHYNAYQKERLGWLNSGASPAIQYVTSNGIYYIEPYETPGSGPKGLKILRSVDPVSGARTWYYLEHRTPTGFDSGMSPYNLQNGILLHTATEGDGQDNYLLDMTPLTASWYDPALAQGQSYTDAELGLTITVISADNAGAAVQIQLAAQACVRAIPTVTVTPGRSNWVQPGGTFNYQVSVRNNNSGGCSNEQFNLASNMPAGLSGAFSNGSLTLENGASGGTGLYVSSIPTAADGVYNFGVSATNGGNAAMSSSASAQQVLLSRLGVSAVAGAARYSRTQTVTVTPIVTAAGSPVGNATVTFTMTSLDGRPVRQTAITGADGRAVFSYRLDRKRDLAGTYSVSSVASLNGFAGQATTSFVVK
jgi:hypothetical protein